MERHVDTSIASHLLAAINVLPPLRQEYTGNGEQQTPNRPAPLEPSAAQESYNSSQYQQRRSEATSGTPQQQNQAAAQGEDAEDARMAAAQEDQPDKMDVEQAQNGVEHKPDINMIEHNNMEHQDGVNVAGRAYPAILPSGAPVTPAQKAPTAVMQSSTMPAPIMQTPQNKNTSRTTQTPASSASKTNSSRRVRRKWTEDETNDLIKGCHIVRLTSEFCRAL
jgi:hypothetical protein